MKENLHSETPHRYRLLGIGFLALFFMISLIYIGALLSDRISQVDDSWNMFKQERSTSSHILNNLIRNLGYGGFIHKFKNYIIRQDAKLIPVIEKSLNDARTSLGEYSLNNVSQKEQVAINKIAAVINQYEANFKLAIHLIEDGYTVDKLDKTVKIDDAPAFEAIDYLSSRVVVKTEKREIETASNIETTFKLINDTIVLIPFLFLLLLVILSIFLHRIIYSGKLLRETSQHLTDIFNAAPDAMLIVAENGLISSANKKAIDLFGYTISELSEMQIEDLIPERFRKKHIVYRNNVSTNFKRDFLDSNKEFYALTNEGLEIPIELSLSFTNFNNSDQAIASVRNISERKDTENALRHSEEILKRAQNIANLGSWEWDFISNKLFWSQETFSIFGLDPYQTVPSYDAYKALLHPEDREMVINKINLSVIQERVFEVINRIIRPDGEIIFVNQRCDFFKDREGNIINLVCSIRDITKQTNYENNLRDIQQQVEKANAALEVSAKNSRLLRDIASVANAVTSSRQAIELAQQMLCGHLDWSFSNTYFRENNHPSNEDEYSYYVSANLWYEKNPGRHTDFKQSLQNIQFKYGEGVPGKVAQTFNPKWIDDVANDKRFLQISPETIPFHSAVAFPVIANGEVTAVIECFSEDCEICKEDLIELLFAVGVELGYVIERKRVESQLESAKQDAEIANKAKSEFLATMSHEIRTPMNGVVGMLHLLARDKLEGKQKRYIEAALGSSELLLNVINDILDFSKIEAGKLELESVHYDLSSLIEETAVLFAGSTSGKDLDLFCCIDNDIPHTVKGDPTRIRQIISNFIGNSIKFTSEGEVVLYVKQNDSGIRIGVSDTGIGLTADQKAKIMEPFTQADSATTRKYGGTGLGLTIASRLIEAMGGKLSIYSEYGKGSDFYFTLPFKVFSESKVWDVPESITKQRVLIANSHRTGTNIICSYLENWHVSMIDTVETGSDTLKILDSAVEKNKSYDIVLLDKDLSGQNGTDLITDIRRYAKLNNTKIILCCSLDETDFSSDANAFLFKPIRQDDLFSCLLKVTGNKVDEKVASKISSELDLWFGDRHVLLVEDNLINQEVAKELLSRYGFTVDVKDNGLKAVHAVQNKDYDLVLMDMQMPVMDGLEATRKIRDLGDEFSTLPIIATTANALSNDIKKCLDAGMDAHVSKPIDPKILLNTIAEWVEPSTNDNAHHETGTNTDLDSIPSFPGLDIRRIAELYRMNWEQLKPMLIMFRDKQHDVSANIEKLINNNDLETAAKLLHKLKGSSGSIGAKNLYDVAVVMEELCLDDKQEAAQENIGNLHKEFGEVLSGLAKIDDDESDSNEEQVYNV